MQASTAAFGITVAGAQMTVTHTVTIALPAGPYSDFSAAVDDITIDRQTVTDMPDATRLVTGYPSAQASMTISGYVDPTDASKTVAWLLNPNNPASPMYRLDALGAAVTVKAGLWLPGSATPETFTVFTGVVDDYTVDPQAGTVSFVCLDGRNRLSGPVTLPTVYDDGTSTLPTLYSQFFLDAMLRQKGIYSWPAQRASCKFAAGMRGSAYAEVGGAPTSLNPALTISPNLFDNGVYGMGLTGVAQYTIPAITGSSTPLFFECFHGFNGGTGWPQIILNDPVANATVTVNATSTQMIVTCEPDLTGLNIIQVTLPIASAEGYHAWKVSWVGTLVSVQVWRGANTSSGSNSGPVARPATNFTRVTVETTSGVIPSTVESGIQITTEASPTPNNGFVPGATLGLSLNPITTAPDVTGTDIWTIIQQIAQAEGAVQGFDETGVFRSIDRRSIQLTPAQRSITPTYSLKTLQQQTGNSFVRNHIQVPVNAVQLQPFDELWSLGTLVQIGSGGTYTTTATLAAPAAIATATAVIPGGGLVAGSGYRAARNKDGTGGQVSNLVMTVVQTSPTTATVTVANPNGFSVWLVSPTGAGYPAASDGLPSLGVGGRAITSTATAIDTAAATAAGALADWQWPPAVEGGAATNPRGELLLPLPSNPWIQNLAAANLFAEFLGEDLYRPKPLWRNVAVVPDPRLQLTDRVTINDPDTTLINDDALLFGVHLKISESDYTQDLDMRSLSTPGGWLIGQAGRSEIGATTWI